MTSHFTITLGHVRAALNLPDFDAQAAWQRMSMRPPLSRAVPSDSNAYRRAGVLVLLYPVENTLTLLLMRRTPDPGVHSGQLAGEGAQSLGDQV